MMSETEKLRQTDLHRKNIIMLLAFSFAVLGALAVTFVQKNLDRSIVYGSGLIAYVIGFFILTFMKRTNWFPYYMVLVGNITMIVYTSLYGGGVQTLGIFFFILFISTAHFILPVFVSSFILGLIGLTITR